MLNRKGEVLGDELPFWIFYMVFTGAIILAFAFIPQALLAETSKTHNIEGAIFGERVYNQFGSASLLTGRTYPGRLNSRDSFSEARVLGAFDTAGSPRQLAFKLSLDGKEIFHNRELYVRGAVLAGGGYERSVQNRALLIESENRIASLTVDQVFVEGSS